MHDEIIAEDLVLVDSHTHLDTFGERIPSVLEVARSRGVRHVVICGQSLANSRRGVEISETHPELVSCAPGLHPGTPLTQESRQGFVELILTKRENIKLLGGILNYRDSPEKDLETQRGVFREFVRLACEFELPMTIHAKVDTYDDMARILQEEGASSLRKSLHGFEGSHSQGLLMLELGFFISVGPNMLSNKSVGAETLIHDLPLDRMLLETDAYYKPQGGEQFVVPASLPQIAEEVAHLKDTTAPVVARHTTRNFEVLTNAPLSSG